MDNMLQCEWRFHRFEWQCSCAIHAHGCGRLGNDPGLCDLTTKVYNGLIRQQKHPLSEDNFEQYETLIKRIKRWIR